MFLLLRKARRVGKPTQLLSHVLNKGNTDFVSRAWSIDGLLQTRHDWDITGRANLTCERLHLNLRWRVVVDPHNEVKVALVGLAEERAVFTPFLDRTLWYFEIVVKDSLRVQL